MVEAVLFETDQETRLFEMGAFGFCAVDSRCIDIDDLLQATRPGAIVRCYGNPQEIIRFYPPGDSPWLGCVAGWISEDA